MIWKAIKEALGFGREVVRARTGLKVAKIEAQAEAIRMASQSESNWEAFAAQNAANSWLDEFWTLVLALPLIMSFVPWLRQYVADGFEALEIAPDWYVWAVFASVSFAFARKGIPALSSWLSRKAPK